MKRLFSILAAVIFISSVYAQETDLQELSRNEKSSGIPVDFVLQFEPSLYLNTESTLVSAPSPIIYPVSIGFLWPDYSTIAIEPTLSFFMMNHLLYENKAIPAEIENRTTTTLSFMLNIPVVFSFFLHSSRFQLDVGPAILMRFGLLSPGVKESDSGWTGTAAEDVTAINSWFWNDLRWFYLTAGGSWLYNLDSKLMAGPVINISIPLGGLIVDKDAQGMLISLGIKICR